jgi:hypothetical protein
MNETRQNFYIAVLNHHLEEYRNGQTDANEYMVHVNDIYDKVVEEAGEDDSLHGLVYQLEQHMDYITGQLTSENEH